MSVLHELLARKPMLRQTCPEIVGAAADFEALRAENAKLQAQANERALMWTKYTVGLEDELSKLRAALEHIDRCRGVQCDWLCDIARAALNEETK